MIRYFADHPTASNLLMVAILLLGLAALPSLNKETFPEVLNRNVQVSVPYPGASTSEIEEGICNPIEEAITSISFLEEQKCQAQDGLAIATITMLESGQINLQEQSTQRSFKLAQENLKVGETELERIQSLYDKKLVARSTLDAEKQRVISLRQQVEDLQGQLNTFNSRKDAVKADIARIEQQIKGNQSTLGKTEITLPFDARIGEVSVERGEFVSTGQILFEAINQSGVEIRAELAIKNMMPLVSYIETNNPIAELQAPETDSRNFLEQLNLSSRIRLAAGVSSPIPWVWEAKVLRIGEAIDPIRRTIALVVGVEDSYKDAIPGRRPPLIKGMYVSVEFSTPPRDRMVIPRRAIHEGRVYLVKDDNTLAIRSVDVMFYQQEFAVIRHGLTPGERIISSDVNPVIEGMPIEVMNDVEFEQSLTRLTSQALEAL